MHVGKFFFPIYSACWLTNHFTEAMCAAPAEHASRKQLLAGCHVSGSLGQLIPSPDPNKNRCICQWLFDNVVSAVGPGKYLVACDNDEMMECPFNHLHVESRTSTIPPDVPPIQALQRPAGAPPQAIAAAEREMDELIQAIEDSHEDNKHLPPAQQVHDPDGRMPGQVTTVATVQQKLRTYTQWKEAAKEKICQKIGEEVTIHQRNEQVVWKVVTEHHVEIERDTDDLGLIGNDLLAAVENSTIGKIFLQLTFADWKEKVDCLSTAIEERNTKNLKSHWVCLFTISEFLVCLGHLIGAPECGIKGTSLWQNGKGEDSAWLSIMPHPNFDCFIPEYHFRHFREFFPSFFRMTLLKILTHGGNFLGPWKNLIITDFI
jgi:hypothetical protein